MTHTMLLFGFRAMQCRRCHHRFRPAPLPLLGIGRLRCPACATHVGLRDGALGAIVVVTIALVLWLMNLLPDTLGQAKAVVATAMAMTASTLLSVVALLCGSTDVSPPPAPAPAAVAPGFEWINTRFGLLVVAIVGCGGWVWLAIGAFA